MTIMFVPTMTGTPLVSSDTCSNFVLSEDTDMSATSRPKLFWNHKITWYLTSGKRNLQITIHLSPFLFVLIRITRISPGSFAAAHRQLSFQTLIKSRPLSPDIRPMNQ
jgi:hypothetical protein